MTTIEWSPPYGTVVYAAVGIVLLVLVALAEVEVLAELGAVPERRQSAAASPICLPAVRRSGRACVGNRHLPSGTSPGRRNVER